ncbi:hypothetical protein [Flavobacterium degerlachei]|jgi:hypothetical protein|uniref:Transglutaminase-like superfamily protein n=1 Tax=Flavobacterium degerlachei TaxID=229203 RepID=A0A1H3B3A2_9FLAO|nr:hypothetical protein [Flavobacterium degerlachei]SDX36436.1 hypothetical protein SAMN05444338_109144 [Flavobacterium degerlachei]
MSTIDTLLYRPLKSGTAFEGLIPAYQGTDFKFDKNSDNSTTYDTLRFMEQWSNKYASQMKRIAPLLKGRNIEETANNIYQFLYNHFQYKLDGETQNLYSPSAAWHFRKTGFDCKTYSILASTILQNLNITHAFRMVQQAGIMPGEWSHVYVVIPNGNKNAIIDATTHTNKEVSFTKKHDYTMKHRGLASPYINGLGCACQGKPLNKTGLGSPSTIAATVANFHMFLNEIENKGVPKEVTSRMLDLVKWNVQNGIDPNIQEIVEKAYAGANKGLGYSLIDNGTSLLNNASIQGVNVGGVVTNVANGNYVGAALDVLKAVLPIEKTFGAVFANSFDLSCWGASYSEQKAKIDIEKDMPFIIEWSGIYKQATTANLDKFQILTEAYLLDAQNGQRSKYASCTRKGHALRDKAIVELRKNIYQEFTSQGFKLVPAGKKSGTFTINQGLPGYRVGQSYSSWTNPMSYDSFTVVPPQQQVAVTVPQQSVTTIPQQGTTTVYNNPAAAANTDSTAGVPPAKKSSATIPLLIGAGALALKFLI